MSRLDLYADAVSWLEEAVSESKKADNVDLNILIGNCKNTYECIQMLLPIEEDALKLGALNELSLSLQDYLEILCNKKRQLDGVKINETEKGAVKDDDDCKRRRVAIEDTIVQKGTVKFCDIVGLTNAKQALKEAIIMPLQFPHLFTGGRQPWRRILLYGPPGTGKTRLAQAVASEINSTFYSVSSSDLVSSWVGESEKLIKELFHNATSQLGQSVVFIDEIDSICRKRSMREEEYTRRIKTELLKQMEGTDHSASPQHFILLCATNCPWELDTAFLRRFQKRIYIPLPDKIGSSRWTSLLRFSVNTGNLDCMFMVDLANGEARIALIKMHLAATPVSLSLEDWRLLGDRVEGFSGSDLSNCTSDAMFEPVRELEHNTHWKLDKNLFYSPCSETENDCIHSLLIDLPSDKIQPRPVTLDDFLNVLSRNTSTVTEEDVERFEQFTANLGQKG